MQGVEYTSNVNSKQYSNITQIHFCPISNNLMMFKENNNNNMNAVTYEWACLVCNYKEAFTVDSIVISTAEQYKPIDYSLYKFDKSLKRCKGNCPYCKSIQELCIFYYENNSMKNGYVCTNCDKFFKNE